MSRNRILHGEQYEFRFEALPGEVPGERRLQVQARSPGSLTFREVSLASGKALREVEIPIAFLLDVWPVLRDLFSDLRGVMLQAVGIKGDVQRLVDEVKRLLGDAATP